MSSAEQQREPQLPANAVLETQVLRVSPDEWNTAIPDVVRRAKSAAGLRNNQDSESAGGWQSDVGDEGDLTKEERLRKLRKAGEQAEAAHQRRAGDGVAEDGGDQGTGGGASEQSERREER